MSAPELASILQIAVLAADMEMQSPVPVSSVPNPDGSPQPETRAERERRMIETAVMHLIEQGLLVVPDDITQRLARWIPIMRDRP